MADVAGDARNEKTPLRGVCGARNAAAMAFRAAAAPSFRFVTKSARMRTYCTQNGARHRLVWRFFARTSGVRNFLPLACLCRVSRCGFADVPLGRIRPSRGGRRCERRAGVRRTCRARNGIAFCRSRHFPLAACLGRVVVIRSGRSRFRRGTAAFWRQAAGMPSEGAFLAAMAHVQNGGRIGYIVKC